MDSYVFNANKPPIHCISRCSRFINFPPAYGGCMLSCKDNDEENVVRRNFADATRVLIDQPGIDYMTDVGKPKVVRPQKSNAHAIMNVLGTEMSENSKGVEALGKSNLHRKKY